MKKLYWALPVIAGLFLLYQIFTVVDHECFHSKYINKLRYSSDCDYKISEGYKLVFDSASKEYAISTVSDIYSRKYLYTTYRRGITDMYESIAHPCVFEDSCAAKGYFKAFIEQTTPMKNFK